MAGMSFIIIRLVIMACKLPAVKKLSTKAVRNTEALRKINFKTEKELKDIGYFLVAAFVFDLFGLPANLAFLLRVTKEYEFIKRFFFWKFIF